MTYQQSTARRLSRVHAEGIISKPEAKSADCPLPRTSQISPEMLAACVVMSFSRGGADDPNMDLGVEVVQELQPLLANLAAGDTAAIEKMLFCQAIGLQTIFTRLSAFAMQETLGSEAMQSSLNLALQAQGAGRASLEALAHIKEGRIRPSERDPAPGACNRKVGGEPASSVGGAVPRATVRREL
jgi:hypothetical protein